MSDGALSKLDEVLDYGISAAMRRWGMSEDRDPHEKKGASAKVSPLRKHGRMFQQIAGLPPQQAWEAWEALVSRDSPLRALVSREGPLEAWPSVRFMLGEKHRAVRPGEDPDQLAKDPLQSQLRKYAASTQRTLGWMLQQGVVREYCKTEDDFWQKLGRKPKLSGWEVSELALLWAIVARPRDAAEPISVDLPPKELGRRFWGLVGRLRAVTKFTREFEFRNGGDTTPDPLDTDGWRKGDHLDSGDLEALAVLWPDAEEAKKHLELAGTRRDWEKVGRTTVMPRSEREWWSRLKRKYVETVFGNGADYQKLIDCGLQFDAAVFLHWLNRLGDVCRHRIAYRPDVFDELVSFVRAWGAESKQDFMPLLQYVAVRNDGMFEGFSQASLCALARRRVWLKRQHVALRLAIESVRERLPPGELACVEDRGPAAALPHRAVFALVSSELSLFGARSEQRFKHLVDLICLEMVRTKFLQDPDGHPEFAVRLRPVIDAYRDPDLGPRWTLRNLKRYPQVLEADDEEEAVGAIGATTTLIGTPSSPAGRKRSKGPFEKQMARAKAIKSRFVEAPFSHVSDPLAFLERSWVKARRDPKNRKGTEPAHFGHFPWISALLLFPLAWYFGTIRAVVDAEVLALCG
jgi:hypothetical protein